MTKFDREASIDRLLRHGGTLPDSAGTTEQCLTADTVAAWTDGTLDSSERAAAETHAADCVRCQALLAAMARTAPAAPAASWWRVHAFGWLVPLSVAASAVIVWTVVKPRPQLATNARTASVEARAAAAAPAQAIETPPPATSDLKAANPVAEAPARAKARGDVPSSRRERALRDEANSALAKKEVMSPPRADADNRAAPIAQAAPSPIAAPVPAAAAPPAAPAPPAAASEPAVTAQGVTAAAPAPRQGQAADRLAQAPASERAAMRTLASAASRVAAPIVVVATPNAPSRWRLQPAGVVEHSVDGGVTWQAQPTGVVSTLTAGASPSPSVCWIVGPQGIVLLSTDGRSWRRVTSPASIDLVQVTATDDKQAVVTAVDARTFATADGGVTWTAR